MEGKIRTKWIESILRYQEHDFYGYFILCEHHFKRDDFIKEDGKIFLQERVIPSVFPEPQPQENNDGPSNTEFHGLAEYSDEEIEPASSNSMDPVCKTCINLNIDLIKAKKMISLLQKKVLKQKKTIDDKKKEIIKMRNEIAILKTEGEVYLNSNKSIVYNCIYLYILAIVTIVYINKIQ